MSVVAMVSASRLVVPTTLLSERREVAKLESRPGLRAVLIARYRDSYRYCSRAQAVKWLVGHVLLSVGGASSDGTAIGHIA